MFDYRLVVQLYKSITGIDFDLPVNVFPGIQLKEVPYEVPMNLVYNMCSEVTHLKLLQHFPGAMNLTLHVLNFPNWT